MAEQDVVVWIRHIRAVRPKLCSPGARQWFAAHGFSWNDFLENGKSADELEATGDPFALTVTAIARQEAADGQQ